MIFTNRREAGRKLAKALIVYQGREDGVVIGLPRGGVAVAYEIARTLKLPLDVYITRKIGVPGDPELSAGAITENGDIFMDPKKLDEFGIHPMYVEHEIARKKKEIAHQRQVLRGGRPCRELMDHTVIVVDDGIATGATIFAALKGLKRIGPRKLVLAVPVAPLDLMDDLKAASDEVVVLAKPYPFFAVGGAYWQFDQLSDEEVAGYLRSPLVLAGASGISV